MLVVLTRSLLASRAIVEVVAFLGDSLAERLDKELQVASPFDNARSVKVGSARSDDSVATSFGREAACISKMLEAYIESLRSRYNILKTIGLHLPVEGETDYDPPEG